MRRKLCNFATFVFVFVLGVFGATAGWACSSGYYTGYDNACHKCPTATGYYVTPTACQDSTFTCPAHSYKVYYASVGTYLCLQCPRILNADSFNTAITGDTAIPKDIPSSYGTWSTTERCTFTTSTERKITDSTTGCERTVKITPGCSGTSMYSNVSGVVNGSTVDAYAASTGCDYQIVTRTAVYVPRGYRKNTSVNAACSACTGNTYANKTNQSSCKNIPSGSTVLTQNGLNVGFSCAANYYARYHDEADDKCVLCPRYGTNCTQANDALSVGVQISGGCGPNTGQSAAGAQSVNECHTAGGNITYDSIGGYINGSCPYHEEDNYAVVLCPIPVVGQWQYNKCTEMHPNNGQDRDYCINNGMFANAYEGSINISSIDQYSSDQMMVSFYFASISEAQVLYNDLFNAAHSISAQSCSVYYLTYYD